ncbi:MAG: NTP transferase domain-containing protein [Kiritimatiellales bacterium]|nr:NTP transferase domain-containing protein [Kiritimatiellales bacterium]
MQITQAILPVAGLGTRFLPWTKAVPKELLPIGNQPIIAHLVDECIDAGITDICFVISKGKEMIPQYFFENPALEEELEKRGKKHLLEDLQRYKEVDFHTVYQDEQHGDGHAILQAADWVKSDTVAILFGDDLFTSDDSGLTQLIKAYDLIGEEVAMLALENIPKENTSRYGIVDVEHEHDGEPRLKKLKGLVEKPQPEDAPSTLGIVGRYLIPQSTFDVLPKVGASGGGEIRLIDALIEQMPDLPVYGYECKGTRLDTGTPEGYQDAVKAWKN